MNIDLSVEQYVHKMKSIMFDNIVKSSLHAARDAGVSIDLLDSVIGNKKTDNQSAAISQIKKELGKI